ncbi:MAG: PAS domain S-box protein [Verrucomicrobiae bacterium]
MSKPHTTSRESATPATPATHAALRERAEKVFREDPSRFPERAMSPEITRMTLHELRVHQIELEMQNEQMRHAQSELDAARARYFDLYDVAPVGYCTLSEQGVILEANLTAATLLGVERSALVKMPLSRLLLKKDQDTYYRHRRLLFETGNPQSCDLRVAKPDGEIFWAHFVGNAARGEGGAPTCRLVLTDITALKQNEEKILHLSQAVEQSPALIVITNRDGEIEYVNPKFCAVTGFSREEVLGRNPRFLKSGDMGPEDYKKMWASLTSGNEWQGEFHNKKKSGELYWESTSISPIRDAAGRISHFLAVKEDITERKRTEKALQEKIVEMERFTLTVSHDLKSPLVTIKTFLGYLKEDMKSPEPERVEKDLAYIQSAADKMERLLDEVLELARIGHKMSPHVSAPLQIIVQEALELVAGQITARGVQVDVTQEPVWITGDRPRLVAIFENLLDNAVKFLGDQPAPRIEIGVESRGSELEIFVRDNGKGIDARHRAKLFGLFEKLDPHTPGSGMGLATVRRIVEIHGGKIRVQSDGIGKGTTFRFTLANTQLKPNQPTPA